MLTGAFGVETCRDAVESAGEEAGAQRPWRGKGVYLACSGRRGRALARRRIETCATRRLNERKRSTDIALGRREADPSARQKSRDRTQPFSRRDLEQSRRAARQWSSNRSCVTLSGQGKQAQGLLQTKLATTEAYTGEMAKVIGFISEKGGTGKTTACYHIAVALQRYHDKRVLIVDADYQRGGITGRFFPELVERFGSGEMSGTTMFHKFQELYSAGERSPEVDVLRWRDCIDVIVSDPRLSTVTEDKLPSTHNIRENNRLLLKHLQVVDYVLGAVKEDYDYILIDSHPEVSDVLRSVVYSSDYCVSPVKFDRQSSIGVATVMGEINNVNADVELIRNSLDGDLEYADTVFSGSMGMMAREWGGDLKQTEYLERNRLRRTGSVFDTYVTEGDGLRRALLERNPVFDVSGNNAGRQAQQLRALTLEFLGKCP